MDKCKWCPSQSVIAGTTTLAHYDDCPEKRIAALEVESEMRLKRMDWSVKEHVKACIERDDWKERAEAAEAKVDSLKNEIGLALEAGRSAK